MHNLTCENSHINFFKSFCLAYPKLILAYKFHFFLIFFFPINTYEKTYPNKSYLLMKSSYKYTKVIRIVE